MLCLAASEGVEDQKKADCGGLGEAWEPAFCTSLWVTPTLVVREQRLRHS